MHPCPKCLILLPLAATLLFNGCKPADQTEPPAAAPANEAPAPMPPLERAELLPAQTRAHLYLSDADGFVEQLKKSSLGKLCNDRQFKAFLGNPDADIWKEILIQKSSEAEAEMLLQQIRMLQGEVLFAFTKDSPAPSIIAAMTEADFLHSLELDEKMKTLSDTPFQVVKKQFQGVEIYQYIDHAGTAEESSSWQAHLKETLVLGHSQEWVERSIVQLKKHRIEEPEGHPLLSLDIDLSNIIQTRLLQTMKSGPLAGMCNPQTLLEALGLLGMERAVTTIEMKNTEMVVDSRIAISDLSKGLFALLNTRPTELPTVAFIPEDLATIEVGRIDLLRFWQELATVLETALPAFKPQFDQQIAMVQQLIGIDLENDLLANTGTRYVSFAQVDDRQQSSIFALELTDMPAFRNALDTLSASPVFEQIAAGLELQDFLDHTLFIQKNVDPQTAIAFTAAGDHLCYGPSPSVRQLIRTLSAPPSAGPGYLNSELVQGLRRHVPANAFAFSAIDWKKNMALLTREFNRPEYTDVIRQKWAISGSPLPPPDFSKLPPADHIASFFNTAYQYVEADSNGLHQRMIITY